MATTARNAGWNRLSLAIVGAGVASLIAAAVLIALTVTGTLGDDGQSGPGTVTGFSVTFTPQSTATPLPPSEAPMARFTIPKFEVNAPVVIRGVDPNGVMETPDGPEDVAWYDFTSRPGFGSNAVFSAHVDYYNYGPAVFWHLKDLAPGDVLEVHLDDGTVYRYAVYEQKMVTANLNADEIKEIVGSSEREIITLITCGGTFNSTTGQYEERLIVRAERIIEAPPAGVSAP